MDKEDLLGERFGSLEVYGKAYKKTKKIKRCLFYVCRCDCGNDILLRPNSLINGGIRDCGCKRNLVGTIHGHWEVLCRDTATPKQNPHNVRLWCRCIKCGSVDSIPRQSLNPSSLKKCKTCQDRERAYPKAGSRIYRIWLGIKRRCKGNGGQNTIRYYAGRNIKYQPSWESFKNFYDDMKDGYNDELQLDRIDPDGDYTKENCRWVTAKENCRNRRDNSIVIAGGESHALAWWLEKYGTSKWSLPKYLKRDYGDDWEIHKGHRQNWLPTPRYHV
jgi:hypothetical protein